MARAMSRVQVSNVPASHWLAGCLNCDFFDGMLASGVRDKCSAGEEVDFVTGAAVLAEGDSSNLWADLQPTRPCCNLPGHSE